MKRATFLFTNDLHGNITAFNTIIELKKILEDPFIIDTGDTFSNNYYSSLTSSFLQEYTDIWLPGNHDLNILTEIPEKFRSSFSPIKLASNLEDKLFSGSQTEEVIIDISGIKTGFIGIAGKSSNQDIKYLNQGRTLIQKIRKLRNNVELLILLSHVGINEDLRIANAAPEIDLIFGGHSHSRLKAPEIINKTLILQSGGFGDLVGCLRLNLDRGKIQEFSTTFTNTYESTLQKRFLNTLNRHRENLDKAFILKDTIAYKRKNINPITAFILNQMNNITGSSHSAINSSTINPLIIEGKVTFEDLRSTCGFDSSISIIKISEKKALKAIERSKKDHYTKIITSEGLSDTNRTITISMPTFIAKGGHHSFSAFQEFREAPRMDTELHLSDIIKTLIEKDL